MRTITREEVRSHLFQAHHLVTPADSLPEAAGVCGFQNSPPGTWLCAAFNRLRSCSAWQLQMLLEDVLEGRAALSTIDLIEKTAQNISWSADCAIGQEAADMVHRGFFRFMMQWCIWMHFVQRKGSPGSIQTGCAVVRKKSVFLFRCCCRS